MTRPEMLQVVGALISAFASVALTIEQRLVKRLRALDATDAETAVELGPLKPLARWRLARLARRGAARELEPGRLYLDETASRRLRRRRARLAVTLAGAAVVVVVALHALL